MEKMLNLVLFGPPGAGKGTQSENLINKYGLVHLSTGDILRTEIARGTDLGRKAKDIMDRGELVGDDIVIGMIESKLDENPHAKGFIFDGFPRTTAQAVALDDLLQKKGTGISGMLALEVDDEELTKRLLLRGKDSGRADDRDEPTIRRRIQEYNNKTLPLKNYYSEQGKFHSIAGIGSIDEIFKSLVDRIVFLHAEMDLTSLESDLEHLDLTIQDFEIADDIAPELLLEIDAIKRAEAEEEEENRANAKVKKKEAVGSKQSAGSTLRLRSVQEVQSGSKKVVQSSSKKTVQGSSKKVVQNSSKKKVESKKPTKKAVVKAKSKPAKKVIVKKSTKKVLAKKTVKKVAGKAKSKPVKKALPKKSIKKVAAKKSAPKKSSANKGIKKAVSKTKASVKKSIKKTVKKAIKKRK
jgi:adenylate kinase